MTTLNPEIRESPWRMRLIRYAYIAMLLSSTFGIGFGVIGGVLHDTYIVYREIDTDGTILRAYGTLTVPYILYGLAVALFLFELIGFIFLRVTTSRVEVWLQTHHIFYTRLLVYSVILKVVVYVGMVLILIGVEGIATREGVSAIIGTWGIVFGAAAASWMSARTLSSMQSLNRRDAIRF